MRGMVAAERGTGRASRATVFMYMLPPGAVAQGNVTRFQHVFCVFRGCQGDGGGYALACACDCSNLSRCVLQLQLVALSDRRGAARLDGRLSEWNSGRLLEWRVQVLNRASTLTT